MSEEEIVVVAEPASDPYPSAPLAAPADESTVGATEVESVAPVVDNRPDHLRTYQSVQEAFAAQDERLRGHPTMAEAFEAYQARRADSSRRLMIWAQGGES